MTTTDHFIATVRLASVIERLEIHASKRDANSALARSCMTEAIDILGELRAENDRLRSEIVAALTDAGEIMPAEGATAPGEIPRAIGRLAADAKRWRKFEGDCGGEYGEIIEHRRTRRPQPIRLTAWAPGDMATAHFVDDMVPVRQIRFRWLDIDGKRRTLREMIDAQLRDLSEDKTS